MLAFLARVATSVGALRHGPEDVPVAGRQLHEVLALLHSLETASGRNQRWWQLRTRELEIEMMRLDYARVLQLAAELLATGDRLELRRRVAVESSIIRVLLEAQPLGIIHEAMDLVFASPCYHANGPAGHMALLLRGLLAERRGERGAATAFLGAWQACDRVWGEPIGHFEILTCCAEHAYLKGSHDELAGWLAELDHHNRGYPCDEFRVCYGRVLCLRLESHSLGDGADLVQECERALVLLSTLAERAHYWRYALFLLYLLAEAGAADRAGAWQLLIPSRFFERALWAVDCEWYLHFQQLGLPPPSLRLHPGRPAPDSFVGNVAAALRAKLMAGYRAAANAAASADARLECRWRSELVQARMAQVERHS